VDVLSIAAPICIGDDRFNRAVNATAGLSIRNIVFPRDPITTLPKNVVVRLVRFDSIIKQHADPYSCERHTTHYYYSREHSTTTHRGYAVTAIDLCL